MAAAAQAALILDVGRLKRTIDICGLMWYTIVTVKGTRQTL